MAEGHGSTVGQALLAAIDNAAGGRIRKSYTAKHWHAQLTKLTSSPRGYMAAEKAGVSATAPTLKKWLSDPEHPIRRGDRDKIARAYAIMRGEWPKQIESKSIHIHGEVEIAGDQRNRGTGMAPFTIDGSMAGWGRWSELQSRWEEDDVDEDWLEDEWFGALIEDDLGEMSDPPTFPGGAYRVVIA